MANHTIASKYVVLNTTLMFVTLGLKPYILTVR